MQLLQQLAKVCYNEIARILILIPQKPPSGGFLVVENYVEKGVEKLVEKCYN